VNGEIVLRILALTVLITTLVISGFYRWKARREGVVVKRLEEGGWIFTLRLLFGLPLLASMLFYIFYPSLIEWAKFEIPHLIRLLCAIVALLNIPFLLWTFRSIGRNISETVLTKSSHELVTCGPYRWIRHPLYSSGLLLVFSFSWIAASGFIFVYFLVGLAVFRLLVIPAEERRLIESFGQEYLNYREKTGALMPKVL
jgi:protein-S-isoprenylcysteine O-methyltransferase